MKYRILLIATFCWSLFSSQMTTAQSFSVQADTVWATVTGSASVFDTIINHTDSTITLNWRVIATDFPSDWRTSGALGICDANLCRPNAGGALWPAGTTYSCPYTPTTHLFDIALNLSGASSGTHWITIEIVHPGIDSASETYVINKWPASVSNINNADNNILLYPNPAVNELNVVYNANADIKNIAIYNIIGKVMAVYKVSGTGANMSLENMPSGIYFVRLTNSHGDVVATKKFTKQ